MCSKSKAEAVKFERSNSEPRGSSLFNENQIEETKVAMMSRANQLKKAREDFFFGKESSPGGVQQPESSPIISRPTNLPIRSEKGSNLQDSPSLDNVKVTCEPNFCPNDELSSMTSF